MHNMTEHTVLGAVSDLSHAVEAAGPVATVAFIVVVTLSILMCLAGGFLAVRCICELIYRRFLRRRMKSTKPELVCILVDMTDTLGVRIKRKVIIRDIHSVLESKGSIIWIGVDDEAHHTYGKILKTWTSAEDKEEHTGNDYWYNQRPDGKL